MPCDTRKRKETAGNMAIIVFLTFVLFVLGMSF